MGKVREVSRVTWLRREGGRVTLLFENCLTGGALVKTYKTETSAKVEATKFHNRIARLYG